MCVCVRERALFNSKIDDLLFEDKMWKILFFVKATFREKSIIKSLGVLEGKDETNTKSEM